MLCINFCFLLLLINIVCLNKPASAWEMSSIIFFVLFLFLSFYFFFFSPPIHSPSSLSLHSSALTPPPLHCLTHNPQPYPTPFIPSQPPASTLFALCIKSPEPKGSESQPTPVTNKETLGSHLTAERLGGSVQVLLLLLPLLLLLLLLL